MRAFTAHGRDLASYIGQQYLPSLNALDRGLTLLADLQVIEGGDIAKLERIRHSGSGR